MLTIDIITLFPKMFKGPFEESIVWRANQKGLVNINIHDLRKWGQGIRKTVDDRPYGGGVGMVLMIEPIFKALEELRTPKSRVIALTAQGTPLKQKIVQKLTNETHLILLAGHYEGFDARILEHLVDEEISIGDYIVTGGELPAMLLVDSIVRLIPGVLPKPEATELESFSSTMTLEHPHYTRPEEFNNWAVPKVLLSGDHRKITDWKTKQSNKLTKARRPDLIK